MAICLTVQACSPLTFRGVSVTKIFSLNESCVDTMMDSK
jgi:hypothetical protein